VSCLKWLHWSSDEILKLTKTSSKFTYLQNVNHKVAFFICFRLLTMVWCYKKGAKWIIFKPNPQVWYILEGIWMAIFDILWNFGKCTLWPFALSVGNLVYFVVICYIVPISVHCIKKYLATLITNSLLEFVNIPPNILHVEVTLEFHFPENVHKKWPELSLQQRNSCDCYYYFTTTCCNLGPIQQSLFVAR
jgi:hypothetical protein